MFFEDGWTPLSEVTSTVFRRLQALRADGAADGAKPRRLQADLAISVWDICDSATKVGVTGPDGTVIPASKDLVAWADPVSLSNEHLSLQAGNVGSSTLKGAEDADENALRTRYGMFLYLPVVLPVNNVQSSLTFLEEEIRDQDKPDPAVKATTQAILAHVADGSFLTREIARQKHGAALSRRKFKMAWALASREQPELRDPARWTGL